MKTKDKHLVYIEDVMYEIMQYPNRTMTKSVIKDCATEAVKNHSVTIWKHLWNLIKEFFVRR